MAANIRCIMRAKAPYGQGITKMKVKLTPEQSSTPSLMPETNSVYLTRPTEGTGELMELVGGSVAWNQLAEVYTGTRSGVTVTDGGQGDADLSGTISTTYLATFKAINLVAGHKYVISRTTLANPNNVSFKVGAYNAESVFNLETDGMAIVTTATSRLTSVGLTNLTANTLMTGIKVRYQIIDLTAMLPSDIADYVYSLEQATAGSGIQWLKDYDLIDDQYHAYSAPTLQSVEATAHVAKGKNLFDGSQVSTTHTSNWGITWADNTLTIEHKTSYTSGSPTFPLSLPSGDYVLSYASTTETGKISFYRNDSWVKTLNNGTTFTVDEADTNEIRFSADVGTPITTVNIQIESGMTATEYSPYHAPTIYPLDSDLVLRGIPKLNNGNLYYDGDTYEWDGTVNRRWGIITLEGGTEATYAANGQTTNTSRGIVTISGKAFGQSNIFSDKFVHPSGFPDTPFNMYGRSNNSSVEFYLPVSVPNTGEGIKAWFAQNPTVLLYELATATTESADPFTAVQTVEDGGTEEFVTTNNVPVGVVGRFANAVPMEGVDSFTVTANDGTSHTYPVTLSEEIYRGYVDMLTGEAISDMASIAEYNGETINAPWLSSLDVYALGATPTRGAQVVYPIAPEEVTATITGDPSTLSGVVSATSTEGTVDWSELSEIGIKCIMKRKNPFQ